MTNCHRGPSPQLAAGVGQAVLDDGLDQAMHGEGVGLGGDLQKGIAPQGREDSVAGQRVTGQAVQFRGEKFLFCLQEGPGDGVRGQEGAEVQEGGGAGRLTFGIFQGQGPGGGHAVLVVVRAGFDRPRDHGGGFETVPGILVRVMPAAAM